MVTGINENVEVLGRVFHVQTELTPGNEPKIRTAVFIGGRMIASRTRSVDAETSNEDEIRQMIRAQQAQIIDNFVTRAAALADGADGITPPYTTPGPVRQSPPPVKATEPPDAASDPILAEAIAVRELITRFRKSLDDSASPGDDDLKPYLKKAAGAIRTVTDDPVFVDVRLDEQVAFYDLKGRIAAQLKGDFEIEVSREVWTELRRFCGYLGRINQRRELIDFDQKLFTWALAAIGNHGMSDDVLAHLNLARGRSDDLANYLAQPKGIESAQWMEILMQLIDTTF